MDLLVGSWLPLYSLFKYATLLSIRPPSTALTSMVFDNVIQPILEPLGEGLATGGTEFVLALAKFVDKLPPWLQAPIRKIDKFVSGFVIKAAGSLSRMEIRLRDESGHVPVSMMVAAFHDENENLYNDIYDAIGEEEASNPPVINRIEDEDDYDFGAERRSRLRSRSTMQTFPSTPSTVTKKRTRSKKP